MSAGWKKTLRPGVLFVTAAVCSAAVFLLCYHGDNKYTAQGPQAQNGVLSLSEQDLRDTPLLHLVTGWELYRGRLLAPEDFADSPPTPDEMVFIGQYGGFEGHIGEGVTRGPHGSATYRLVLDLPDRPESYTLELPEIYSAYRLYLGGDLLAGLGRPEPEDYRAETGNRRVSFHGGGRTELILAVSDYSHFYSGLVYPPAFGHSGAVDTMLNTRFAIRAAAAALALGVGVFYLAVGFLLKKSGARPGPLPPLYAALCACFAVYISYPVVKTLWAGGGGWYSVENVAFPAMLLLTAVIQSRVSEVGRRWDTAFTAFGVFVCCLSAVVPRVTGGSLNLMLAYSHILTVYTWACAAFLLAGAARGVYRGSLRSGPMLCAAAVFGTSLVTDRLLPLFEPIRLGWFSEISGAVFVLAIGAVMAAEVAGQFHKRFVLEGRMENAARVMEAQKAYFSVILEKEDKLRKAQHDFRHHIAVIRELTAEEGVKGYADGLLGGSAPLTVRERVYCANPSVSAVAAYYLSLAEDEGVRVEARLDVPEDTGGVSAMDLCVILGNLLENALEACRRMEGGDRFIRVSARAEGETLSIATANSFDGRCREENGVYLSRKDSGKGVRKGVGLSSIEAVCEKHRGLARFEAEGPVWKAFALVNTGAASLRAGEEQ